MNADYSVDATGPGCSILDVTQTVSLTERVFLLLFNICLIGVGASRNILPMYTVDTLRNITVLSG